MKTSGVIFRFILGLLLACGGLLLWALLVILGGKPFLAGLIQFGRMNSFLMISGGVVLVLLMYFLGSRSVPLVRAAEGLGNNSLRGIGLVAFCPITVPVLLYALFSSRSR